MSLVRIQGEEERLNLIYYEFNPSEPPLGVGGMGKVYRGVRCDKRTGTRRDVAIKFLYDDVPESVVERARREASIRLKNDSLIEMLGFIELERTDSSGRVKSCYHVVSEFVDGVGLDDLMGGKTSNHYGQPIPFAQELLSMYRESPTLFALRVARELLTGLMSLHDAGYVHRDIDPSNIMVTTDGHIKLIDFGIAKKVSSLNAFDKQLTSSGQFMGKACYAAPELVLGDVSHQDSTTDIYAVGIMLFEMVTGHLPFDGPINEVLMKQLHDALPLKDVQQKALRKVIDKATQKKQSKRYVSAVEFRVDIDSLFKVEIQNDRILKERLRAEAEARRQKEEQAARKAEQERARQEQLARERQEQERARQEQAAKKAEQERIRQEQAEKKAEQKRGATKTTVKKIGEGKIYKYAISCICGCAVLVFLMVIGKKITNPVPVTDITEDVIVSYSVSQVKSMLLNPEEASKGWQELEKLVSDRNYEAVFLQSRIFFQSNESKDVLDAETDKIRLNLGIEVDNEKAHNLLQRAVDINPGDYKSLFELGCDFKSGQRGTPRDIKKAKQYLTQAQELAQNDPEYLKMISERLKGL